MSCGEHPLDCITGHIAPALDGRAAGPRQWSAICPACGDGERKLSISIGDKARVVLKCHRDHTYEQIRAAMPLAIRGCLGRAPGRHRKRDGDKDLAAVEDLLSADYLSPAALRIRLAALLWQVPPAEAAAKLGYSDRTWRRIRSESSGREKYR